MRQRRSLAPRAAAATGPCRRLVNLGTALTGANQLDEAVVLLRRAVDHTPDDQRALTALAQTLHRRFDGIELVSICRRLLANNPAHSTFWHCSPAA